MRILSFLALGLLLSGCVTTPKNQVIESKELSLAQGEGIVLVNFSCDKALNFVSIYASGKEPDYKDGVSGSTEKLWCTKGYNTLKLPEGDYYMGGYVGKAILGIPEAKALKFSVSANKVNYLGTVMMNHWTPGFTQHANVRKYTYSIRPFIRAFEEPSKKYVMENLPKNISSLEFVTHTPKR